MTFKGDLCGKPSQTKVLRVSGEERTNKTPYRLRKGLQKACTEKEGPKTTLQGVNDQQSSTIK